MKITRITVHQVDLPLREGTYSWSGGKSIRTYDSTVVRIHTDAGLIGHGEVCPLGPAYLPAYAKGVRAGLAELAPHLLGQDPRQLGVINRVMEQHLKGHPYVKSALDIACWDILGLACGVPVSTLLGGCQGEAVKVYRAISQDTPERMVERVAVCRAEGHHHFQIKVGGLTVARQMRDLCVAMGVAMTIEDSGGSDIVTAAIVHLAHSTPEAFRFSSSDVNGYNTVSIADGGPRHRGGYMKAPAGPGLGVTPYLDVLGKAVLTIS